MAQQTIGIGTAANDGTGDPLRTAFTKVNDNFTEVYAVTTDADIVALAALAATAGLLSRTGAGAFAARTLTGTANQITVSNGDGASGNPTVSFPSSMSFAGKTITDLGSVTTADINGGTVDGAAVGASSPSTGAFTTLSATSLVDLSGASAGQVKFPSSANPSANANTFDDYKEYTFTVTAAFATPGTSSWSYASQAGRGTKLGRVTQVNVDFTATPTIGTGSGVITLSGFPYTSAANQGLMARGMDAGWAWGSGRTQFMGRIDSGATGFYLETMGSATANGRLQASNMTTGVAHTVNLSGILEVS